MQHACICALVFLFLVVKPLWGSLPPLLPPPQEHQSIVWSMLMRIPTNRQLHATLADLAEHKAQWSSSWRHSLQLSHPLQQLYVLQVVSAIVQQPPAAEEDWIIRFVAAGGFQELLSALQRHGSDGSASSLNCIAVLLQVGTAVRKTHGAGHAVCSFLLSPPSPLLPPPPISPSLPSDRC